MIFLALPPLDEAGARRVILPFAVQHQVAEGRNPELVAVAGGQQDEVLALHVEQLQGDQASAGLEGGVVDRQVVVAEGGLDEEVLALID